MRQAGKVPDLKNTTVGLMDLIYQFDISDYYIDCFNFDDDDDEDDENEEYNEDNQENEQSSDEYDEPVPRLEGCDNETFVKMAILYETDYNDKEFPEYL